MERSRPVSRGRHSSETVMLERGCSVPSLAGKKLRQSWSWSETRHSLLASCNSCYFISPPVNVVNTQAKDSKMLWSSHLAQMCNFLSLSIPPPISKLILLSFSYYNICVYICRIQHYRLSNEKTLVKRGQWHYTKIKSYTQVLTRNHVKDIEISLKTWKLMINVLWWGSGLEHLT